MESREPVYQEKVVYYTKEVSAFRRKMNLMSLLRLLVFVVLAVEVYYCFASFDIVLLFAIAVTLIAFVILVVIHSGFSDKKDLYEKLLEINLNELAVLNNKSSFFSNGLSDGSHESYEDDLDIFGTFSVFHLLNRTTTKPGTAELVKLLSHPLLDKKDIEDYQLAIKMMDPLLDNRQLITASGLLNARDERSPQPVINWLAEPPAMHRYPWLKFVRWILPVLNLVFGYYFLASDNIILLLISVAFSWIAVRSAGKYIGAQSRMLNNQQQLLAQYNSLLAAFNGMPIVLPAGLEKIQALSRESCNSFKRLSQLLRFFDQRSNLVVNLFLNSFFLYDVQCMIALEGWKIKNRSQFPAWLDCMGVIESLNSLATFAFNNPAYVYPVVEPAKGNLLIEASQIAHPLIPRNERVANDALIGRESRFLIITGSNMSGKTTFLRSIGANLLLAQCGAPVCAARFSFTPMNIFSSIRINDSLQEHTSYFMAELKKLKKIIDQVEHGIPALVLIDEILRGTSSDDKTYGSEKFIKKLMGYNCIALIATHDLRLSEMEKEFPSVIANCCFESVIKDNDLYFDYKLRPGVAKNKNASFLMERMKII
jgi:ABC-type multidrug transport system fused ATPase/permease subunit